MQLSICFMCLNDGDLTKLTAKEQDHLFKKFVKYVLPDYIIPEQKHSLQICTRCRDSLYGFYKFKKISMANNMWFITYVIDDPKENELLSENKIEIKQEKDELPQQIPETEFKTEVSSIPYDFICEAEIKQEDEITFDNTMDDFREPYTSDLLLSYDIIQETDIKQEEEIIDIIEKSVDDTKKLCTSDFEVSSLQHDIIHETDIKLALKTEETLSKPTIVINDIEFAENDTKQSRTFKVCNNNSKLYDKNNFYQCLVCYKIFDRKYNFTVHMKIHAGIREHQCETCGKKFSRKAHLQDHRYVHIARNNFECGICGKTYKMKKYLIQHMQSHSGLRPFHCSFCDKQFIRKITLQEHEKIHKNIKDFPCSFCGRKFRQRGTLNTHLLIHRRTMK